MSFPQAARDVGAASGGGSKESYLDLKDGHIAEFQISQISPSVVTAQGSDGGTFQKLPMKIQLFRWDVVNERTKQVAPFTDDLAVVENWSPAIDSGHLNDLFSMDTRLQAETGDVSVIYKRRIRVEVQKVGRYNRHTFTDLGPVGAAVTATFPPTPTPTPPAPAAFAPPSVPVPAAAPPPPAAADPVATLRAALDSAKTPGDVKTAATNLWPSIPPHRVSEATQLVSQAQRRVAIAALQAAMNMDALNAAWAAVSPGLAADGEGMAAITKGYQDRAAQIQSGNADIPF